MDKAELDGIEYYFPYRDSQRSKVYDAEHACFRNHRATQQLQFLTEEQLQVLADGIADSYMWKKFLARTGQKMRGAPTIRLASGKQRWARGGAGLVTLPKSWAKNLHTFLHEIAHALAPWAARHDWLYCICMLELVEEFMGHEWRVQLEAYYERYKVKFTPQKQHEAKRVLAAANRRF